MDDPATLRDRLAAAFPGAGVELVANGAPGGEASLRVAGSHLREVAVFLRDDPALRLDYASNVTGIDWPDRETKETVTIREMVEGEEKEVARTVTRTVPGFLEVVYHLYSMEKRHGPLVLRARTGNRTDNVRLPSLTPVWRSCELQEREVYDLYGVVFDGHPDLRRLLMWDGFRDHPMRKDYVPPDDFDWEPTPHDDVLARARRHEAGRAGGQEGGSA